MNTLIVPAHKNLPPADLVCWSEIKYNNNKTPAGSIILHYRQEVTYLVVQRIVLLLYYREHSASGLSRTFRD